MSELLHCPNCQTPMEQKKYNNIPSDICPKCGGVWLDVNELDALEDQVMNDDELKGSIVLESSPSQRKCPTCSTHLKTFHYRMYDEVMLEYCPKKHGWFLDKGEEEKIKGLMEVEEAGTKRAMEAQNKWIEHLWLLKNPSFINKVVGFFFDFTTS